MSHSVKKILRFSEVFVEVKYLENVQNLPIQGKTIVLNADDTEIKIEGKPLRSWNSSIYSDIVIPTATKIVCITLHTDSFSSSPFPDASTIDDKWTHVHDIIPLPHLKDTKLWRSDKERVDNIEFNLWFAGAGTDCGIHNEHAFRELHTQVFGIGRMQKFRKNDHDCLYQDVFMSPGYTHEPFYDEACAYPWHQYYADTDCIWLVAEF